MIDVTVQNHGTVMMFHTETPKARQWVEENVQTEWWQWLGAAFAVEHRNAMALVRGMLDAGLAVT